MAVKRYIANADNTITNAYKESFTTRGTGSNMGQADILEVFSLYAQRDSSSAELSRILIQFPVSEISSDRSAGNIPASGSVSFFLRLYNAEHTRTLPRDFKLTVNAVSGAWEEGQGLDMENYSDLTYNKIGSNWINRTGSTAWSTAGGDFYTDSSSSFEQRFEIGTEDMELDVTSIVEQWIDSDGNVLGSKDNHGFLIKLSGAYEAYEAGNTGGALKSYYTKKFFARSSEFFFERPKIEARWDSSRRDNRGNFTLSSSALPAENNLNTLFLYNYFRGKLVDVGGKSTAIPVLNLYYASASVPEGEARYFRDSNNTAVNFLSCSRESTGVYKVTFSATSSIVTSTYPYLVDVWTHSGSQLHTGSAFLPSAHSFTDYNPNRKYVITMPNLKSIYPNEGTERFRLYVRDKNWSPNIFTKATSKLDSVLIESASYQIKRLIDNRVVIPYGTSSTNHTILSYDVSGNYFDLDMSMFEEGYTYGISYSFYKDSIGSYVQQPYIFKIRVEKDEY